MRYFSEVAEDWLLIIDNADDPTVTLSKYLPTGGNGSVLITTRHRDLEWFVTVGPTEVDMLKPEEASDILLRAAGHETSSEIVDVVRVVDTLDHCPLSLALAGKYIKETGCSIQEYLERYETLRTRTLQESPRTHWTNPGYPLDFRLITFDLSLHCIEKMGTEMSLDAIEVFIFLPSSRPK